MRGYTQKSGVTGAISDEINYALGFAKQFFDNIGKDLVITSLADSIHKIGSLHYKGQAVDVRTRDLSRLEQEQLQAYLQSNLRSQGYDVILEKNHLHVEYDPKLGTGSGGRYSPTSPPPPRRTTNRSSVDSSSPVPNLTYKLSTNVKKAIILGVALTLFLVAFSKLK